MKLPSDHAIDPVSFGPAGEAVLLRLDGNAGLIPVSLQCSLLDKDNNLIHGKVVQLTDKQWSNWTTQSDEEYLPQCCAELLGVTLSPTK